MYYHLRKDRMAQGLYRPAYGEELLEDGDNWDFGQSFKGKVKQPIEVELKDTYGTELWDIDLVSFDAPLMSELLVNGLREAGVDNIDVYKATLVDRKRRLRLDNYFAVNIIGRLSAVDKQASVAFDPKGVGHTMVQYRKLVLDEKKCLGQKLFRLHESVTTIVVNGDVKKALSKLPLKYVELAPLETTQKKVRR